MRKRNRILCALLAALLAAVLSLPAAAAETSLIISAPETLPAVGETFTVTVTISGNPGLCAAQYTLAFDPSVVRCESASVGELLRNTFSAANPSAEAGAIVAAATVTPATGDGSVGVFTFQVLKAGETDFTLQNAIFSGADGAPIQTNITTSAPAEDEPGQPEQPVPGGETGQTPGKDPAQPEQPGQEQPGQEQPLPAEPLFTDVPQSFWGYEAIQKAARLGLINGVGEGKFAPERKLTRAEFVTMLWRLAGQPAAGAKADFTDVPAEIWYRAGLDWVAEKGYVTGDGGRFKPEDQITRQEAVTILFRYSGGQSGMETMFSAIYADQFSDSGAVASWAKSAMDWAIYHSVIQGSGGKLNPTGTASRAEIAAIFVRYAEKV